MWTMELTDCFCEKTCILSTVQHFLFKSISMSFFYYFLCIILSLIFNFVSNLQNYITGPTLPVSLMFVTQNFCCFNETDVCGMQRGIMKTSDEEIRHFFKNSSVQVIICPRSGGKGHHSFVKKTVRCLIITTSLLKLLYVQFNHLNVIVMIRKLELSTHIIKKL